MPAESSKNSQIQEEALKLMELLPDEEKLEVLQYIKHLIEFQNAGE